MAHLQNEAGTNDFSRHEFSHEKCSENFPEIFEPLRFIGRQKGGFVKGWFWRTYPRSGFRSGGTCERTLVPVSRSGGTSKCTLVPFFVLGEHPPKPPFWKTTLLSNPEFCWSEKIPQNSRDISLPKIKKNSLMSLCRRAGRTAKFTTPPKIREKHRFL